MSGVKGDFSALSDLRARLATIGNGDFMADLRTRLAGRALELVDREFVEQRDPYGIAWKPSRRAIAEGGETLYNTGALRTKFAAVPNAGGFSLGTDIKYAAIHQYGGVIRPKNGPYLLFKVGAYRARGKRSGGGAWVKVKSVTIPRRQFIPEQRPSITWTLAIAHETAKALNEHMK